MRNILNHLFVFIQHIIPQHLLSRIIGKLADSRVGIIKNTFITTFIKIFNVNMNEAVEPNPAAYATFNDFFVRAIRPEVRPIAMETHHIACPADGAISQLGDIESGQIFQAKGRSYSLTTLLGGDEHLAQAFHGGKFATVYLSPKDYHRVHMPFDGELQSMIYVPGDLFSVNQATTKLVSELFARNERAITVFDTTAGPMAVVLVGAMIVAGIETVWHGQVTPVKRSVTRIDYPNTTSTVRLSKGDEMGRFKLGSTAIVLFGPDMVEWNENLRAESAVKMGESIGELING